MDQVRQFAREMALSFSIGGGASRTRVGVVRFDSSATVLSGLGEVTNNATDAIDAMEASLGSTNISDGLVAAQQVLESASTRAGVPRMVMIVTDGIQDNEFGGDSAAIAQSSKLKESGVTVFAIGFGSSVASTIQALASEPHDLYAYMGDNITAIKNHFSGRFCTFAFSPRLPPLPSPPPSLPPSPPTAGCADSCTFPSDGICDDGGLGSEYST